MELFLQFLTSKLYHLETRLNKSFYWFVRTVISSFKHRLLGFIFAIDYEEEFKVMNAQGLHKNTNRIIENEFQKRECHDILLSCSWYLPPLRFLAQLNKYVEKRAEPKSNLILVT